MGHRDGAGPARLRGRGGGRGRQHVHGDVGRRALRDVLQPPAGTVGRVLPPGVLEVAERHRDPVAAVVDPARVQAHRGGQGAGGADDLLPLVLVLDDQQPRGCAVQQVRNLLAGALRVRADDGRPEGLHRQLDDEPLRAVVAEHGDHVTLAHPPRAQAAGHDLDLRHQLREGGGLPDAVALALDRDRVGPLVGAGQQQLRQGLGAGAGCDAGSGAHRVAAGHRAGTSSPR